MTNSLQLRSRLIKNDFGAQLPFLTFRSPSALETDVNKALLWLLRPESLANIKKKKMAEANFLFIGSDSRETKQKNIKKESEIK
jgi:hypothetical protein